MAFGIIEILIPLAIYLIAGMVLKKDIKHPDDFFITYKNVGTSPVTDAAGQGKRAVVFKFEA